MPPPLHQHLHDEVIQGYTYTHHWTRQREGRTFAVEDRPRTLQTVLIPRFWASSNLNLSSRTAVGGLTPSPLLFAYPPSRCFKLSRLVMIAIQLPLKVSVSSFGIIIYFGSVYSMLILCVSEILRPIPVVNEIVELVEDMDCEAVRAVQTNTFDNQWV